MLPLCFIIGLIKVFKQVWSVDHANCCVWVQTASQKGFMKGQLIAHFKCFSRLENEKIKYDKDLDNRAEQSVATFLHVYWAKVRAITMKTDDLQMCYSFHSFLQLFLSECFSLPLRQKCKWICPVKILHNMFFKRQTVIVDFSPNCASQRWVVAVRGASD